MPAKIVRSEIDTDHRYRITQTDHGYLLSCAQRNEFGLLLGPAEWLYRTYTGAEKGLELVMLMNAWWSTIARGYPAADLPQRCQAAAAEHTKLVQELDDVPLIGEEVRELRLNIEVVT